MTNSVNNTDSTKNESENNNKDTKTEVTTPTEGEDKTTAEDGSVLDFYEDDKKEDKKETKTEEDKDDKVGTGYEDKKVETGYEDKSEEEDTKVEDDKVEDEKPNEIEALLKDLPENIDKEKVSKFATEHKLTKEQVEAYVNLTKEDNANLEKNREAQVKATRKAWKEELFEDASFGEGSQETFDKNRHNAEQILNNHMINTKKVLTDTGGMLPPYIMKDLLKVHNILNPKTKLVDGDPGKVEKEKPFLETMYT